jgi:hypothetical protein
VNFREYTILAVAVLAAVVGGLAADKVEAKTLRLSFACSANNDLYRVVTGSGYKCPRFDAASEAIEKAERGSAVLILADGYPETRTNVDAAVFDAAANKGVRLFVEYPAAIPKIEIGKARGTVWERAVVSSDAFGDKLPKMHILSISGCRFIPVKAADPLMVIARVAGFDTAVYGIPDSASPILFRLPGHDALIATTKLSGFVTGRYAPTADWGILWERILGMLDPESTVLLKWTPTVRPAYGKDEKLPADAERRAFVEGVGWYLNSRLLVTPKDKPTVEKLLLSGAECWPVPSSRETGDGSCGILEGYAAGIDHNGNQQQRLPLRDDCNAEVAMALAVGGSVNDDERSRKIADNLLHYIYVDSGLCGGERANPKHPAFGLIAWGAIAPAWTCANYSDDNARGILGTVIASACLGTDKWDERVMRALLANLRTTGKLGFREDRTDIRPLEARGWKSYFEAENVNYSTHHDSYLWACNLWAYRQTGYAPFLEKTKNAICMTMDVFPNGWRWNDTIERARMLLCLAWLIRVEDTPEHRGWLKTITDDLLSHQQPCGALPERFGVEGGGGYHIPASNEQYGTGETPLIQRNGDPATDQLYTTGFALFGLHEAAAATGDARLKSAEDKLASYLCRIQVHSNDVPYVNGTWFRAFDYKRWDYWASSADVGWGAWSAESGWGPAWITATLGLRLKGTNVWDITSSSKIADHFSAVRKQMAENDGGPWKP